jgi:hypothetical protein
MAKGSFPKRIRRWRRNRRRQPPSEWAQTTSTVGILLLVCGAVLIAVYVAQLH